MPLLSRSIYGIALFFHLPVVLAILLVFTGRLLLTGALHEDGLADFFDGFGGGRSREQMLTIIKNSHIGTYEGKVLRVRQQYFFCSASLQEIISVAS